MIVAQIPQLIRCCEADMRAKRGDSGFDPERTISGQFCCDAPRQFSAPDDVVGSDPELRAHAAARVHQPARRRGGSVAARRATGATFYVVQLVSRQLEGAARRSCLAFNSPAWQW